MTEEMRSQLEKLQADLNQLKEKMGTEPAGEEAQLVDQFGHEQEPSPGKKKADAKGKKPGAEKEDKGEGAKAKGDGEEDKDGEEQGEKKGPKLTPKRIAVLAVVLLALLTGGVIFAIHRHKYEETDDAYVQAYATQLAPKVGAIVNQVFVQENQMVKSGQVLAQLDPKDFKAALEDATASWNALQAQRDNAQRDFHRSESLLAIRVISRQQFDKDRATYLNLDRQAKAAEAKVQQAHLDLGYTTVRAPADGQIARRSVDPGTFVAVGTAIFGFVPSDVRWVDANFKETQLQYMQPGRPAEVTVDAIPKKKFSGVVESVSPSTGSTFTLMPPDNATGNFTKVVQRVPVRIRLKNLSQEDIQQLQAGLSANVNLLKHEPLEQQPAAPAPVFAGADLTAPDPAGGAPAQTAAEEDGSADSSTN